MDHIVQLLEKMGLNHYESRLYLHLLELGETPASVISKQMHLPRSTVRGTLDHLCERGIVAKIYRRNTQYYQCKPPEALVELMESAIRQSRDIMSELHTQIPFLHTLYVRKTVLPKVQYFEGLSQVLEAFNKTLYEEGITEILVLTSYNFLTDPVFRKHDDEFYIPLRVKKGIRLRSIVGNSPLQDKTAKVEPDELRERRFFPKKYSFPGTFYIFGDSVLYFSAGKKEYMAVIIESADMAETMRSLHNFMWEACGE